eukprot:TRINITY_DN12283_c0_g1_i1.p2 TRINITY_DN12283_c0_g1~~TRINITY_DN12283_c0_g1_i1.p2  ORF type:complete len:108 (+),score=7.00 TRINITY_DN12283_c0_g1_i1:303-626(+)
MQRSAAKGIQRLLSWVGGSTSGNAKPGELQLCQGKERRAHSEPYAVRTDRNLGPPLSFSDANLLVHVACSWAGRFDFAFFLSRFSTTKPQPPTATTQAITAFTREII